MSVEAANSQVTLDDMERLWTMLRGRTAAVQEGVLGPSSISWKINRESALFLAAGRASLLQLAHPWVAAALEDHSNLRTDPLGRFHRTFRVIFTMIFGTLDQALGASRYLYHLHTRIQGSLPVAVAIYPSGSHYEANERNALLWVYATLIDSAVLAYEAVLPPLTAEERETYYEESRQVAALFGLPPEFLPASWQEFQHYFETMLASDGLGAGDLARELAERVLHGRGSRVPVPGWYRAMTTGWLPERWREEFRLGYGPRERAKAAAAGSRIRRFYRYLPGALRFVGPYREALCRLRGRPSGLAIRLSNRFWMGQPEMMLRRPKSSPRE